jgi:hypothetical protein
MSSTEGGNTPSGKTLSSAKRGNKHIVVSPKRTSRASSPRAEKRVVEESLGLCSLTMTQGRFRKERKDANRIRTDRTFLFKNAKNEGWGAHTV